METGQRNAKILGISGSLRNQSVNTAILRAIGRLMPPGVCFEIYEGLDRMPFFSTDVDNDDVPEPEHVQSFRAALRQADAVVLSTPEFAAGVPGVLKNALEWTVSSGEFMKKPTAVISASPTQGGGDKANASLLLTLGMLMADIPPEGKLMIPLASKYMDDRKEITAPELLGKLASVTGALIRRIEAGG